MKTKAFIFFSLLICNLLPAQNVKLDIVPHFFGVRADSLLLAMDISIHIDDMDSKSATHTTERQAETEAISAQSDIAQKE